MPARTPVSPIDPRVEMFQRGQPTDTFFNMKSLSPRPVSNATEMFDTDFEDDESEVEDYSPRHSTGRRSETTLSSFEEVHTPSPYEVQTFNFDLPAKKPVEGPTGPHLFRSSLESSLSIPSRYEDEVLGMSPVTPRAPRPAVSYHAPQVPEVPVYHRPLSTLTDAVEDLNLDEVARWSARQVARWMREAGFEPSIVERFEENDISGAILITLKFEDLRELDIPSFGQRTKVWNEIHVLRGSARNTPKPPTPIEECASPCIEQRLELPSRHTSRRERAQDCGSDEENAQHRHRKNSKRRHRKRAGDDIITPLESVSIVGIEQLMPKPHNCSRGENCSKWRRQQRLIENFKKEHPIDAERGGAFWIAGDPGNADTAEAVRPFSDAVPSVVASSDVLGPSEPLPAFRHLEEASLRNVQSRDPQDNVKQFIKFQHLDPPTENTWASEAPPTPPYEMFPTLPTPINGLRNLPKLSIPPPRPPPRSASAQNTFSPYRMDRAEALSPELRSATQSPSTAVYRFGTPFSEMDVPLTAVPTGPVSRDASQSVPPNMSYRNGPPIVPLQRTGSRSSRRPSFAMPRVDEYRSTAPRPQPPPQHQYSPQTAIPASAPTAASASSPSEDGDIAHSGFMKKRKTKMLRHEWHEHHFTLRGTRLSMHKDARALETLEYIDVDDYAIACSSLASGSKLSAAFKAMNISRGNNNKDEGAFAFQLIPAAIEKGVKLKKRDSALGVKDASKIKTHYFAVRSRDERIDWMRELMLAKALKQKSEGYEINVNGNMI
ncbi:PH domain-containing protein [Phlyctema vagabunda]|uniref:PH domain-containing protein n=1 Tax=Phlyctema vagabunda TaxID=108571 RepID=A0ABR4PKS7_9HELO